MNLNSVSAFLGLRANASPTSTNVTNDVQIGVSAQQIAFPTADVAYSVRAIIAGGADFVILGATNDTSGSDAWVAGTAQVETATAAGTISGSGNASVTVTASGMTGSPKTISVPVLSGDTASAWAEKVRTALSDDTDVSDLFTVSGSTTSIVLTRKPNQEIPAVPSYIVNDSSLNIALGNGTCTGITPAATSANTTAGVETFGCLIYDGDGKDFEGIAIPSGGVTLAMLLKTNGGIQIQSGSSGVVIQPNQTLLFVSDDSLSTTPFTDMTITPDGAADVTITYIRKTS
jgi:hypothetical protein